MHTYTYILNTHIDLRQQVPQNAEQQTENTTDKTDKNIKTLGDGHTRRDESVFLENRCVLL